MVLTNKLIIFPFLFSIFPIILLYSENIDEVPVTELTIPLILTFLIIFPLFIVINHILKSEIKAGIIVTFLAAIFFSYGHIFNMLQDTPLFLFRSCASKICNYSFHDYFNYWGLFFGKNQKRSN